MDGLFLFIIGLSLAGGATCLVVFAAGTLIKNRLRKSWLFYLWLVVLLRFVIPVPLNLPFVTDGINDISAVISSAATEPDNTSASLGTDEILSAAPNNAASANAGDAASSAALANNDALVNSNANPAASASVNSSGTSGVPVNLAILRLLPYLWLAGVAAALLWTVIGYALTVAKLRYERSLLTPGRVPVYESSQITTPVLVGIIRPSIYLPVGFLNPELAVRHELMHLRRGDIWLKWFVQLTVCVHWFNPLAYLMQRELNRLSELACDSAVIRRLSPEERSGYGQMLLDTARTVSDGGTLIASLGKDRRLLTERLTEIVSDIKATKKAAAAMSALAVFILCSAILFGAFLSGCTASPGAAKEEASPSASAADITPEASASDAVTPSVTAITPVTVSSNAPSAAPTETALTYTIPSDPPPGFVTDPDVIGTWQPYTLINSVSDFSPDSGDELIRFSSVMLIAYENGRVNDPSATWSKGFFHYFSGQMICEYVIREIAGVKYLFLKLPADVPYNGINVRYEVFKWFSEPLKKKLYIDNIDLPFENDPALIGTWRVDNAVVKIDFFYPGKPTTINTNNTMSIFEGGASDRSLAGITISGFSWTKGVLIDPYAMTAIAYEIKEIDGATYVFTEYKENGVYTSSHTIPGYLVWKKIS